MFPLVVVSSSIKGPYAKDIPSSIEAFAFDLQRKLSAVYAQPNLRNEAYLMKPLTAAVDGLDGDEPEMPVATWAAVNVRVVSVTEPEVTQSQASQEGSECQGEYVQAM